MRRQSLVRCPIRRRLVICNPFCPAKLEQSDMGSNTIVLYGQPLALEMVCVRALVDLMETGLQKIGWTEQAKEYMENNLMAGSNIRQNMWQEVVSRDHDGGIQEAMYSVIFHPCLSIIELVSEGGVAWARGDLPNMDSSKFLKEIRLAVNAKSTLLTKRFHFQGYEYQSCYTGLVLDQLLSSTSQGQHIFPPGAWNRLTDLSLVNYDWLWNNIAELTQQEVQAYYKAVIKFHQAIGQNLPSLVQLELTHPFSLRDDVYFWMFLKSPPAAFPELSQQDWESGRLGWRKNHHRWIPKVAELYARHENASHKPQLRLDKIFLTSPELNPICRKLEHFQIHNSTERLPILSAILHWCQQLMTLDLPEFDILSDTLAASPEHYRRGFLLPCLFILKQRGVLTTSSNIRKICIEDPNSVIMADLWKQHGLDLPPMNTLQFLLDLVINTAINSQDMYIGNNARHAFAGTEILHLDERNILVINQLDKLSILELENIEPVSANRLLQAMGRKLKKVTLTNIWVDLGQVMSSLPGAASIELRNTRVVLNDEEDGNQVLEWTIPTTSMSSLSSLTVDYTVPLPLFEHSLTKLPGLTNLSLGHSRQRYSHSSSVAGMTPLLWNRFLQMSNLPDLRNLSIPVLFQPGANPASQVSILDYEDVVNVFKLLPSLKEAMLHRRQYNRTGEQPNFPLLFENLDYHMGFINVMDF